MQKEENKDREILLLSFFTFLTIVLWVAFELIKTAKTTTVKQTTKQLLTPINPKLDTTVLDNVMKKTPMEDYE